LGLPEGSQPVKFVFHGGSGSDVKDIKDAINYGVIKMNIDTDTQVFTYVPSLVHT
jgi:fructose-bisphosphate aldolase class II